VSFFGINLASRSLQADQRALEVTGQNITNADVPGYSRQEALLVPVLGPGAMVPELAGSAAAPGGGVDVAQVLRTHAAWLDTAAAQLTAQSGQAGIADRSAQQLQSLLAEPTDAGLSATADRFLSAFGNLSSHPEDPAARDGVLRAAQELTGRLQQLSQGLESLRQNMVTQASDNMSQVNDLAKQVAALNGQIGQAQAAGAAPNELIDQRDQLLQQLTERTGAMVSGQEGGELVVSIGGIHVIQGTQAEALSLAPGSPASVVVAGTGQAVTAPGGQLGAQLNWANTIVPGYQSRLSAFRDGLAAAVNSLHQSGRDATGAAGVPFFVADAAGNLSVSPALVADSRKVVAGDGTAGNGSVALAIANLGSAASTVLSPYRRMVADIGRLASESHSQSQQADASRQQIQAMQSSESGVNLDEELAQMVSLQHAYSASARLLSTYDQMLTTLIQQTGQ
jgi:flagellar hook-associated protein 1 FlgK